MCYMRPRLKNKTKQNKTNSPTSMSAGQFPWPCSLRLVKLPSQELPPIIMPLHLNKQTNKQAGEMAQTAESTS